MQFTTHNSPLLQNFQIFYYEVLRQKERALRMSLPDTVFASEDRNLTLVADIQSKLRSLIQGQSDSTFQNRNSPAVQIRDAEYVMTVLADEIFLTLNWPGAKEWERSLLEAQIFETQIAGELFFKRLDGLLDSNDSFKAELGLIYFLALSLGFRGKYRGQDENDPIKYYRERLYIVINQKPSHLFQPGRPLIEQCYDYTLSDLPGRGIPDLRTWGFYMGGVLTLYMFFTYIVWYKLSSEMHEVLNLIFEQTQKSPLI